MVKQAALSGLMALALTACLTGAAHAAVSPQTLAVMEQQLFARAYPQESVSDRLGRLESTVFGSPQTGQSEDARADGLSRFFSNKPQAATMPPINYSPSQPQQAMPAPPAKAADESAYPTVTAMEMRVLNRSFEQDPLQTRLSRLEGRVFGREMQGALSDRSDHLQTIVLGAPPQGQQDDGSGNPQPNPQVSQANVLQALNQIESRVLHRTFPQDSPENRLSRLEQTVFNSTAPEMSNEDRLYRVAGVLAAKQSERNDPMSNGGYAIMPNSIPRGFSVGYGRQGMYYGRSGYGYSPYGSYGRSAGSSAGGLGMTLLMVLMSLL